tara:strand:- start:958 stop:1812 length:855 start_codon:yes stop_codon:yes gene_type:complete
MINTFLKYKTKFLINHEIKKKDLDNSKKILFALFTRYGDTIIDIAVIKEFVQKYPDKDYLFLCPRQMKPYFDELLPGMNCISINKRNLIDMFRVHFFLKNWKPNIGFNPWSNGLDSCYFLTYCDKYLCYKNFKKPQKINHYQVVRDYLRLPKKDWFIKSLKLRHDYKKILICPQSTDQDRTMNDSLLNSIISNSFKKYHGVDITIAKMSDKIFPENCKKFIFKKNAESSRKFISLVKESDLIICTDSAPFHISIALRKDTLLYLKNTVPKVVINSGSNLALEGF